MKRSSLGWTLALAGAAGILVTRCTEITVDRSADGTTTAIATGPDTPPVEIDKDGIHDYPTPTPGPATKRTPLPGGPCRTVAWISAP